MSNLFQPFVEFWLKARCPKCQAVNWIYSSHSQRAYAQDTEACKCHACGHVFWLGEENTLLDIYENECAEHGAEWTLANSVNVVDGKAMP